MESRDELLLRYLDQIPYPPYPVQEQALYAWAAARQGVLLCAPTGTGKTLVAQAALFEALHTGKTAYYTTPLIALTEQKYDELCDAAEAWGFPRNSIGLVTGNRSVNPDATVRVVVAEVLLNRLLHPEAFSFDNVSAVVMDEFHSFNDPERGIVWELSLSMLPKHVRLMLLSATIGNAYDFTAWLRNAHGRDLDLVQSSDRKVPLTYHWVGDALLSDHLASMCRGDEDQRATPALLFCFDREKCWDVADQLRGRDMLAEGQQKELVRRLESLDLSHGAGAKLKRLLLRGVGVHHAGLLPRYRRIVESLFQDKLLSVCVCTETLAAGMNLPARSVVLTTIMKGPPRKKRLIDPSSAHQMFGRAGRPQFDTEGHVYVLAHEDDVRIHKHKQKIELIPEDSKDPTLMKKRKQLIKKTPRRREGVAYWNENQFEKLCDAPAGKLESRGRLPWRLLAHLIDSGPDLSPLREAVSKRLLPPNQIAPQQELLTRMLVTLHDGGFVRLMPPPPPLPDGAGDGSATDSEESEADPPSAEAMLAALSLGTGIADVPDVAASTPASSEAKGQQRQAPAPGRLANYSPTQAHKTHALATLLVFRAVNPVYGAYLLDHLGLADPHEQMQILESLMEMPGSVARKVRVPRPEYLPPGALAKDVIDPALLTQGIATQEEMYPGDEPADSLGGQPRRFTIPLAEKVEMLFDHTIDCAGHNPIRAVWAAGDLLDNFNGDFVKFIDSRGLARQEGVIFRHMLRLILLCDEFSQVTPAGMLEDAWKERLDDWAARLSAACRSVDPQSTDKMLDEVRQRTNQSAQM